MLVMGLVRFPPLSGISILGLNMDFVRRAFYRR